MTHRTLLTPLNYDENSHYKMVSCPLPNWHKLANLRIVKIYELNSVSNTAVVSFNGVTKHRVPMINVEKIERHNQHEVINPKRPVKAAPV